MTRRTSICRRARELFDAEDEEGDEALDLVACMAGSEPEPCS